MNKVWETFEKILPSSATRWARKFIPGGEGYETYDHLSKNEDEENYDVRRKQQKRFVFRHHGSTFVSCDNDVEEHKYFLEV